MYIINIALKMDKIPAEQAEQMFNVHRAWFAQYFEQGNFLMLGSYLDQDYAGVIIAQTENREALDTILAEDVYFPDLADYEVREFKDAMSKLA
ncbi:TPA: YciI family protein [Mannheimia haemolytica]